MRQIDDQLIEKTVADLAISANTLLRKDVLSQLLIAYKRETNKQAKKIFDALLKNADIARNEKIAVCQDTGLPVVFVELGQDAYIKGGDIKAAINRGIARGYRYGFLRKSIVKDPINRTVPKYIPAVIHMDLVKGCKAKISVLPKGFGCENKAEVKMFSPTAELNSIKDFIVGVAKDAGASACPPYIIGVGIGGTQDYACLLAKKTLLKKIKDKKSKIKTTNQKSKIYKLEKELLFEINKLNIGPMGLGGRTTCLGVNIETFPTHIAGLPVAVNISCHALRSATKII